MSKMNNFAHLGYDDRKIFREKSQTNETFIAA